MNILMITHLYYPNIGGVEIAAENLIKQFLKRGHKVNLVTSRWPNDLANSEYINGVKITRLPFRLPSLNIVSLLKFTVRATECITSLFSIAKKTNFDVINLHYLSENALYALILSRLRHVPLVTSIHGSDIELFALKGKFNKWIVSEALNKSYRIIVNSNALLKVMLGNFGEDLNKKSVVISNGVDFSIIDQTKKEFSGLSPFLLGIGRLEHFKGFDVLIEAFSEVKQKFPNFKLVLIGDGQERNKLESLSSRLGLDRSILFLGRLEHKDVLTLLRTCEIFVMPSRREAFGIVNLEAMAAKKSGYSNGCGRGFRNNSPW